MPVVTKEGHFDRMKRERIVPALLYCQAKKGDLELYKNWAENKNRNQKCFYAYYSGLFSRILCLSEITDSIIDECLVLLDKYNWFDIKEQDLELFVKDGVYSCEVPEALDFIDGVDNVVWKDSGFGNGRDAVCLKMEHGSWTFADIRGSVKLSKK